MIQTQTGTNNLEGKCKAQAFLNHRSTSVRLAPMFLRTFRMPQLGVSGLETSCLEAALRAKHGILILQPAILLPFAPVWVSQECSCCRKRSACIQKACEMTNWVSFLASGSRGIPLCRRCWFIPFCSRCHSCGYVCAKPCEGQADGLGCFYAARLLVTCSWFFCYAQVFGCLFFPLIMCLVLCRPSFLTRHPRVEHPHLFHAHTVHGERDLTHVQSL